MSNIEQGISNVKKAYPTRVEDDSMRAMAFAQPGGLDVLQMMDLPKPALPLGELVFARALPARYKRLEWLDLREGKLPNPDVEYPDLGEPAAFACSNRICSYPSVNAEELQATVKQMAKLKPSRAALN